MSKFNIDINDMLKFFTEAGCIITKAKFSEEGGFYINGEKIDPVEIFKEHFQTPINIYNNKGDKYE